MFDIHSDKVLIDAHVHLHNANSAFPTIERAFDTFNHLALSAHSAVLMLAERKQERLFNQLKQSLQSTYEAESEWYERDGHRMLILAGRQIVSAEGLEILGLATNVVIPDGLSAREVVGQLWKADALVVLPWGVGKWLGKRGKLVDSLMMESNPGTLFLGDNSGRPWFWRVPRFHTAFQVLPGSDPLPLQGASKRIGQFGAALTAQLSHQTPSADLKRYLRNAGHELKPYGRPEGLARFLIDQVNLRIKSGTSRATA